MNRNILIAVVVFAIVIGITFGVFSLLVWALVALGILETFKWTYVFASWIIFIVLKAIFK